ncbi:TPA: MptD family putative ECF transporter S component [Streptococcus pneumoniae]|uniref:MptD family putative ECF transporter S component n=1 Tax=Streptococcus pneumoniae TaxID=1313 RepID=UPI000768DC63|nr:MptD family putative ECF transporter S component [Streptococcus pneumoniae]CYO66459.1 permease [Streptococcus pneumoniae]SNG19575.1 permease [Streptococcus pneumoniae]SNM37873.1 permease [Streptococcus pneumoniae]HET1109596.1 MptD family putative ECF transporter S component [Streptococcus pneumoniae]HEX0374280.1 MptD family putative ECF transporter S component [Streptococcus pneumoniae]
MKKSILTTLLFAVLYFLCMGIGVLLGNLFDQTGNMFYAPAFTALVGGSVYMILVAKVPRFGAITTIGLVIAFFFLGTKHGAGSFLSFIIFAFSTTGPILLMWIAPKAYMATLLARGKSQEYIDRIMVTPNPGTVLLFIASIVIGALVGALIGQALSKKFAQKI